MNNSARFLTRLLLSALACWTLARPACAVNPIAMDVASPFAIIDKPLAVQAKFRRWFPIAVTLSNRGDAVQGTVSMRLLADGGTDGALPTYSTSIDLPTNSNKRVWLYGRLERGEISGAEITCVGRGIQTLTARFPIRTPETGTRVVLTISDSDEKMTYLNGFRERKLGIPAEVEAEDRALGGGSSPMNAPARSWVQALGKSHEWIPSRWIGLEAADAVVLQDFPYALAPEQIAALRGYVASGGQLVVLGGADWQRLANAPLADLWPVAPTSSGPSSGAEVEMLARTYVLKAKRNAADRLGGAPLVLTSGTLKPDAQKISGRDEAPLMARRAFGAGEVLWLGFDPTKPPFLGWGGLSELWSDVFRHAPKVSRLQSVDLRYAHGGFSPGNNNNGYSNGYNGYNNNYDSSGPAEPTTSLWSEMVRSPQLRTPPVSYIAWFLALYVFCLVPLNYIALRTIDRRELAWVTVPVIVIAFSVFSYAAALRIKGTLVRTRHVNIVQGSVGANLARADAMLWLFSPRKGYYTIGSKEPQMIVDNYLDATRDTNNGAVDISEPADSSFVVRDSLINMWDYNTFVGHAVLPMGKGVDVQVVNGVPRISNNSPQNLRGVALVANGQVRAYGDINAGQSTSQTVASESGLDATQMGSIERASQLEKIFPGNDGGAYDNMAKAALRVALGPSWGKDQSAWLIAWSDHAAASLVAEGEDPQAQSVTLWVFRLPANFKIASRSAKNNGPREADVRLVDSSSALPNRLSRRYPAARTDTTLMTQTSTYEASFDDADNRAPADITIRVEGSVQPNYSAYNYRGRRYPDGVKKSGVKRASLQAWDWNRAAWQAIPLSHQSEGGNRWNFDAKLDSGHRAALLRPSSSELRLRITTIDALTQIGAVHVRADR